MENSMVCLQFIGSEAGCQPRQRGRNVDRGCGYGLQPCEADSYLKPRQTMLQLGAGT